MTGQTEYATAVEANDDPTGGVWCCGTNWQHRFCGYCGAAMVPAEPIDWLLAFLRRHEAMSRKREKECADWCVRSPSGHASRLHRFAERAHRKWAGALAALETLIKDAAVAKADRAPKPEPIEGEQP